MNNEEKKANNQNSKLVNYHNNHHNVVKIPDPNQDFNLQTNTKHKRSNSTTSNLSIIDLNDSDKDNWNFFTSTQNLASVLNDPNVNRTVSEQIFIKDWGSYFNEVNQLSSNLKQFKMRREYIDRFIQNLNNRDKFRKNLNESRIEFYNFKDDDLKDKQQFNHNSTKATNQINKIELTSINLENLIPSIYLKENFKLENLETFKEILNDNNDDNDNIDNNQLLLIDTNNLTSNNELIKQKIKELEKKLTDYLDIVEEHLAKQISVRFRDFFHIMNAMELVMDQLNTTIKEVTLVRKNCSRLQETLVYPSLKNIQLTKKKSTLQSVYEKIRIMSTVHETQPTIKNFLSTYDYVGALDLITATQEVYDQDLNGLNSFKHLNSQLSEIKKFIIQMMKEDFVKFLTQEWNRPFTKLELELNKYSTVNDSLNFNRMDNFNFDKEKLSCMIIGMLKVKHYEFVETFKDEASTTIEASIKQTVIECLTNIEDTFKSISPFDQLNELDYYRWLNILNQIFNNLYIVLKRIQTIHIVVGRTIYKFELLNNNSLQNENEFNQNLNHNSNNNDIQYNNNSNPFDSSDDQNENHNKINGNNKSALIDKLDKCLFKICQFSHRKCADIIISKMKDYSFISKVSFDEYLELVKLTEKFTSSNQSICLEYIPQLKLALREQTNKYVSKFHDGHKKSILSLLEIEQWKPFEQINPEFQQIINDIIEYNCSFNEIHKSRKQQSNKVKITSSSSNSIQYLKYLEINGEKFIIVYTIISFVHIIIEYCSIAAEIKSIALDLLTRLVSLFKHFNSKVVKLG